MDVGVTQGGECGVGVDVGVTQGGECGECGVGVDLDGEAQSVSSSSLSDKALATSIQSTPVASFVQCNTVPARPHDLYIYIYRTWGVGATRPGRFRTKSASSRAPSGNSLTVRELPDPARELREQIPELPVGPRVVRFRVTPKPSTEIYTYIYMCLLFFIYIYIIRPPRLVGNYKKGM